MDAVRFARHQLFHTQFGYLLLLIGLLNQTLDHVSKWNVAASAALDISSEKVAAADRLRLWQTVWSVKCLE